MNRCPVSHNQTYFHPEFKLIGENFFSKMPTLHQLYADNGILDIIPTFEQHDAGIFERLKQHRLKLFSKQLTFLDPTCKVVQFDNLSFRIIRILTAI
jgi:hypothetical protein